MADDDDDYLSDKFLLAATAPAPSAPKTYAQRRKDAQKQAQLKQEQNRLKSRLERELEAREEGLSKSLFERAQEEEASGSAPASKALAMMMKMGFKPGQALGKADEPASVPPPPPPAGEDASTAGPSPPAPAAQELSSAPPQVPDDPPLRPKPQHLVEPLPLNEWTGRKGIGLGKRALSPSAIENMAKVAKVQEHSSVETFRERARREHEERRAEGRLDAARRTCVGCDERAGRSFNVLWLNADDVDSFPEGLLDALDLAGDAHALAPVAMHRRAALDVEARLRVQMQADALHPLLASLADANAEAAKPPDGAQVWPQDTVDEARVFLGRSALERLTLVLAYLREEYSYCFWCGTQYVDAEDLAANCPGEEEEAHD